MQIEFVGWNTLNDSDKIWGITKIESRSGPSVFYNDYVIFWGKRGAKMQSRTWRAGVWDARKLINKKIAAGYADHSRTTLGAIQPDLKKNIENTVILAALRV